MHRSTLIAASVGVLARLVSAQVAAYGQCGGTGYSGSTSCVSGYGCVVVNDYYSQCQPGAPVATTAAAPTTLVTTTAAALTGTGSTPTTGTGTTGTGPGTTLQSGYYWIRAVESPNFHKYLQSKPLYTTGPAVMGDYTTAGQFQVVDGQLVQLISSPGATAQLLYGIVSTQTYNNNQSLQLTFSTTKNSYGTFGWQGDGLTWSTPGVSRPNSIAWYVCTGQLLYINLGNYLYNTPSGCADETIHYYNAATTNNK